MLSRAWRQVMTSRIMPPAAGFTGRFVRAGLFAVLSLALAVAAHAVAGGGRPPIWVLGGALGALLLFALAVTGRERRGAFIGTAVIVTQLLLHAAFALLPVLGLLTASAGAGTAGGDQSAIWVRLLFCHHGAHPISTAQLTAAEATLGIAPGTPPPSGGLPGGGLSGGELTSWPVLGMLAAHLVAASLMAWWLRRGERAAWALSRQVAHAVRTRVARWADPAPAADRRRRSSAVRGRDLRYVGRPRYRARLGRAPPVVVCA